MGHLPCCAKFFQDSYAKIAFLIVVILLVAGPLIILEESVLCFLKLKMKRL